MCAFWLFRRIKTYLKYDIVCLSVYTTASFKGWQILLWYASWWLADGWRQKVFGVSVQASVFSQNIQIYHSMILHLSHLWMIVIVTFPMVVKDQIFAWWHENTFLVFSASSAFPSCISGAYLFGWDFCVCDHFFNPAFELVTFRLRGWCMLGVFLLPAFTCLGHACNGMHVLYAQTGPRFIILIRKSLGGMESEPMLIPREKIPSTGKILLRGGSNPWHCIKQNGEPNTLPAELLWPPLSILRIGSGALYSLACRPWFI